VGGLDRTSEWHEEDLVRPLLIEGAFQEQQDVADGATYRVPTADCDDSNHRMTTSDSLIGIPRHALAIVGEHHTALSRRPIQHDGVVLSRRATSLDEYDIEIRPSMQEAFDDGPPKILVGGEADHR